MSQQSEERRLNNIDSENVITTGPISSYTPTKNADGNPSVPVVL